MLVAKLFAVLTILLLALGAFEKTRHQHTDIYYHGTYFVMSRVSVWILQAIVSACFGLIYFAAARWMLYPLNNFVAFVQFVLVAIGFVLMSVAMDTLKAPRLLAGLPNATTHLWPYLAFKSGAVSFMLGCGVLAVNLTWIAFQLRRPR